MTKEPTLPDEALEYLRELKHALGALGGEEKSEIIAETRGHLLEVLVNGGPEAVLDSIRAFGDAETYASGFIEDADIRAAVSSRSLAGMLLRLVKLTERGFVYFLAALIVLSLFALAFGFLVMAVLKPVFPEWVGLWTFPGSDSFALGFVSESSRSGGTEHLGYWIIPLGLAGFIAFVSASGAIMRRTLRSWLGREAQNDRVPKRRFEGIAR